MLKKWTGDWQVLVVLTSMAVVWVCPIVFLFYPGEWIRIDYWLPIWFPIMFTTSVACTIWSIFIDRRHRRAMEASCQEIALALGLSYQRFEKVELWSREDCSDGPPLWHFLSFLQKQFSVARDILSGKFKNHEVMACVVDYSSDETSSEKTHFKLKHQKGYPQVLIYDKTAVPPIGMKKLAGRIAFGQDPLSREFSKNFRVFSSDEAFAHSVCHVDMMKYLLALRGEPGRPLLLIEILGHSIRLDQDGHHIEKTESRLNQLVTIYSLLGQVS